MQLLDAVTVIADKKMQGASFFFLCLGFLATSSALVISRPTGNGLNGAAFGSSLKSSNVVHYPELPEPTEEEWVELLEEIQNPSAMAEKNFTVQLNDTGSFSDTPGNKGDWNETAYVLFKEKEGESSRFTIGGAKVVTGGKTIGVLGMSKILYSAVDEDVAVGAEVSRKASFIIHKNDTFELLYKSLTFSQSMKEPGLVNGTRAHFSDGLTVTNASNIFTLSESHSLSIFSHDKGGVKFDGKFDEDRYPLSGDKFGDALSQTVEELVQMTEERNGEITHSHGNGSGFYTLGEKGTFGSSSQLTFVNSTGIYLETSGLNGTYAVQDSTQFMQDYSFLDMLDCLTKGLF